MWFVTRLSDLDTNYYTASDMGKLTSACETQFIQQTPDLWMNTIFSYLIVCAHPRLLGSEQKMTSREDTVSREEVRQKLKTN